MQIDLKKNAPSPFSMAMAAALLDLRDGFSQSWIWTALSLQDIKLRYRGSILGPFWLTLSTLIMIVAIGTIYARLLKMETADYLPFLTIGLIVWQFISSIINDGCQTFLSVQNVIQQVPLPFSIHVYRNIWRNVLVLAHSLIIVPFVLLIFDVSVSWRILLAIPAFAVLILNGIWISFLLGMLSARYRDVPPIVANFMQVIFFVTPIFWSAAALTSWQTIAELNPFFAAVDVFRAPLLNTATASTSWPCLLIFTVVGSLGTLIVFARFRSRIAFWI